MTRCQWGCEGKKKYHTWTRANQDAASMRRSGLKHGTQLTVYGCRVCGRFHIGSERRRRRSYERSGERQPDAP